MHFQSLDFERQFVSRRNWRTCFYVLAIGGAEFPQLAIIASVCAFWMGRQVESDSVNPLVLTVAGDNAATGVIASLGE